MSVTLQSGVWVTQCGGQHKTPFIALFRKLAHHLDAERRLDKLKDDSFYF